MIGSHTPMLFRCCRGLHTEQGFTLIELIVALLIGVIVSASIFQLLITQSRSFGRQQELTDVHATLRSSVALLGWELRHLAPSGGDLYAMSAQSITLRSIQGGGIACVRHATQPNLGLTITDGDIAATAADSVLIFSPGEIGDADDSWKIVKLGVVGSPASLGVATCAWGGILSDVGIAVVVADPSDTVGITAGSPVRVFRRVEYGIFQDSGRWWFGRKVHGAVSFEKLAGPLRSQTDGGLEFRYYDAAGAPVVDPTLVAVVEIVMRAESARRTSDGNGSTLLRDTLATKIALRG